MSQGISCPTPRRRARALTRAVAEPLERRTLLAVTFTADAFAAPSNRPDVVPGDIAPAPFPEMLVAINPRDPANIALPPGPLYVSGNAGAQFADPTLMPLPAGYTQIRGDPVAAYDAEGRLFLSLLVGAPGVPTHIGIGRMDPVTGEPIGPSQVLPTFPGAQDDKQWLAADANPHSPFANNLYMAWARRNVTPGEFEVFFSHSRDQGQTWSTPIQLSDFDGPDNTIGTVDDEGVVHMADIAVAPTGDVFVAYHAQPEMRFVNLGQTGFRRNPDGVSGKTFVLRLTSSDGGVSFVPQSKVEAFPAGTSDISINTQDALNGGAIPGARYTTGGSWQARVLPDPVRPGHVYVIAADDPDDVHGSGDDADIVIARSTDNGLTWTRSTIVSGPLDNSFQLFPSASIDRFGNIAIAWYDNRRGLTNSMGSYLLDFMVTYSTDGGLTWAPEFRVNDLPFDPDPGAINWNNGPPPTTRIGEYFGINHFGGTAHVAWNGNVFSGSTPIGQTMYYSSFAIPGSLTVTGDDGPEGASDDAISINPLPGNPDFVEIVVNGRREYAGLFEGLTGITIDAGAGTDTISIASTGAMLPITILGSAGDDIVNVNVSGNGNAQVIFADTQRLNTLAIGSGGVAVLRADGSRILTVATLDLTGSGTLDLADNSLIVDYTGQSVLASVKSLLTGGYNAGAWNGAGINSSVSAATPNHALGYAEASDLSVIPPIFGSVDDSAILVTYTRYGDADLNRVVNLNDFNHLAASFGQTGTDWLRGNLNYDNNTNLADFNLLAANFGQMVTAPMTVSLQATIAGQDCQPTQGQFGLSFTALYDNSLGSVPMTATIVSARAEFSAPGFSGLIWDFSPSPSDSGEIAPGQSVQRTHVAMGGGTWTGVGSTCDYCGGAYLLTVSWNVSGRLVTQRTEGFIWCSFFPDHGAGDGEIVVKQTESNRPALRLGGMLPAAPATAQTLFAGEAIVNEDRLHDLLGQPEEVSHVA